MEMARGSREYAYLREGIAVAHAKCSSRKEAVEARRRLMAEKAEWVHADIEISINVICAGVAARGMGVDEAGTETQSGTHYMTYFNPLVAIGVFTSTAVTDATYVFFNAAVSDRRRLAAASWSSLWYMLSAFAVISYTHNAFYVLFAAAGSWIGAFVSLSLMKRRDRKEDRRS